MIDCSMETHENFSVKLHNIFEVCTFEKRRAVLPFITGVFITFTCQPNLMESHERDAKGNSRKVLQDNKIRVERESEEFQDKTSTSDSPCFCNRKVAGVHCNLCKMFTPNVRLRKICPRHPNTVWLMDLQVCPKCFKGTNLQEFLQLRVEVRPKRSSTSSSSDSDL
nr:PREDICTED: uncharacterized protein LOC109033280 isoform X1 [Bemisia tabaci]